jgi:hypothetical protein
MKNLPEKHVGIKIKTSLDLKDWFTLAKFQHEMIRQLTDKMKFNFKNKIFLSSIFHFIKTLDNV